MTEKKGCLIILGLFIFATVTLSVAAEKKKPVSKYSHVPFELTAEALPPKYDGDNIIALYNQLKETGGKRAEFESSNDFQKRISSSAGESLYAFVVQQDLDAKLSVKYDADRELFNIKLTSERTTNHDDFSDKRAALHIKQSDLSSRSYIGQNAYGAKVTVNEITSTNFLLALLNGNVFGVDPVEQKFKEYYEKSGRTTPSSKQLSAFPSPMRELQIDITMTSKEASQVKKNLSALVIGILKAPAGLPLVFEGGDMSKATIDNPTEVYWFNRYINFEVHEVWFFDYQSGHVLKKIDFSNPARQKAGSG